MPVRVRAALICAGLVTTSIAGCSDTPGPSTSQVSATASATCTAACHQTSTTFLDGKFTVTFPVPWAIGEDQPVEFSGGPLDAIGTHRLLFWTDILPVDAQGHVVTGVPRTAGGLLTWLQKRPNLAVTAPRTTTIGASHLAAQVLDISIPGHATSEDPGCPAAGRACVTFLTWPGAGTNLYGIQAPMTVRLYVSDVLVDDQPHLFAVAVEAQDTADLHTFEPLAQQAIDTFTGPISDA